VHQVGHWLKTAASTFGFSGSSPMFIRFFKTFLINTDNYHSQFFINRNINFGLRISPKERVSVRGYYVSGYERSVLVTLVARTWLIWLGTDVSDRQTVCNIFINVKLITKFKDFCLAFEEEKLFDMESVRSASLKMFYAWRIFNKQTNTHTKFNWSISHPFWQRKVCIYNKLIPTEKKYAKGKKILGFWCTTLRYTSSGFPCNVLTSLKHWN
jgi:hypothetical protein